MAKFINPFTDEGFKRLFGQEEHKSLLRSFLNRLFDGEMVITDLAYLDKESIPNHERGKRYVYDIYCTLNTGEHIIIEMQKKEQDYYLQRTAVYTARCLDRQTRRGKDWNYGDLKAVYSISFLNYTQDGLPETLIVDGQILDKNTGGLVNPYLRLIYIQIPKMDKTWEECETAAEQWIYVLKNVTSMTQLPAHLKEALEELHYFEEVMDEASMTDEERARYEISLEAYREEMNVMTYHTRKGRLEGLAEGEAKGMARGLAEGEAKGMAKGLAEGEAKGMAKGLAEGEAKGMAKGLAEGEAKGMAKGLADGEEKKNLENAKSMRELGVDIKIISQVTGLSEQQILSL